MEKDLKVRKVKKLTGRYGKIQKIVEKELSCNAHDMDHTMRVYELALNLAKDEKGVDLDILKISALLHDIARVKEDVDKTGKICHAKESAKMSEEILLKLGYNKDKVDKIKSCILGHRYKTGYRPDTIEGKILFDSDKIDSLGAISIVRSVMWIQRNSASMFPKMDFKKYVKSNLFGGVEGGRIKDSSKHCLYYEHEIKTKKIPSMMFTKSGKKIARKRLKFNEIFLERLNKEVDGLL